MKPLAALVAALLAAPAAAQLPPGIWSTVEDVAFAAEEGREVGDEVFLDMREDGAWRYLDAYGAARSEWASGPIPGLAVAPGSHSGWVLGTSELRRAARFSCWVSARKFASKPDGTPDWTFYRGQTFDQGGRIAFPGRGEAPDLAIRLRNVTWAKGSSNKPALVLYVHTDDPERAASYVWAAPDASLVGINLRWMQGSCSKL
ncbi:MAG: hypothetical protein MUF47_07150 [Porphyrobacter sp.]|jgi:hypothetical protein|nr:hypothetical protein [Porphyrobacter sp.]